MKEYLGGNCFDKHAAIMGVMTGDTLHGLSNDCLIFREEDDSPGSFVFVVGDTRASERAKAEHGDDVRTLHCWLETFDGKAWTIADLTRSEDSQMHGREDYYQRADVGETYRVKSSEWSAFVALCKKTYGDGCIGPPPFGIGPWDWELDGEVVLARVGKIDHGVLSSDSCACDGDQNSFQ